VFTGQTQFQVTLNLDLSFVYGDSVTPFDLQRGNVGATIATSVLFDDTMLAKWNTWIYGTAAPTAGTKPLGRIPPVGSYSAQPRQEGLRRQHDRVVQPRVPRASSGTSRTAQARTRMPGSAEVGLSGNADEDAGHHEPVPVRRGLPAGGFYHMSGLGTLRVAVARVLRDGALAAVDLADRLDPQPDPVTANRVVLYTTDTSGTFTGTADGNITFWQSWQSEAER
jgi:hypothetical protein